MKKIIYFAIFISLTDLPAFGEEGVITKFDSSNSFISCKVDIAPLKIKSIDGYDTVESLDCYQSTEVGKPSLPVRSFFVLLPPDTDVKDVAITQIDQIELAGQYNIKPVFPPIPISKNPKTTYQIYQSKDFYPENILEISSIQKLRGYSIACISVFGACYNPKTKQLFWNKQINFKLNLSSPKIKAVNNTFRGIREDEELVKGLVVNPYMTNTYPSIKRQIPSLVTYKYVVITNEDLVSAFRPLCDSKPMTTAIGTTSWIYTHYTGVDNQEKIKAFIKEYYEKYGTCYVLLGGDVEIVPYRGVYGLVSGVAAVKEEVYEDKDIPCDLYYACLDDNWNWDADGDKIYGELEDNIDLTPEVYIGRAPVSNLSEATNFVNKVITYQNSQNDYIYKELLIAYILYNKSPYFCNGKEIMEEIAFNTTEPYTVYKEYETEGGGVNDSRIINHINSGIGLIAHANHTNWNTATPFEIGSPIDVKTLSNGSKTFIFNTIGCNAGDFSKTDCIGEVMLLNPNGGAVAFVGNSRYGWFDETNVKLYSGEYQIEFFKKFFKEGYTRIGETLGRSKMVFISNSSNEYNPYRWIMFCLNLLGDPTMESHPAKEIFCIDYTMPEVIDNPGTITDLIVTLKNLKEGTVTGVRGTLSTTDSYITIIKATATFGDMPSKWTSTNSSNPYKIMVKSNCPPIHKVSFLLEISGQEGYENTDKFCVEINLKVADLSQVIHYPNPCYPDEGEILKIANIPLNSNPTVYIYNLAGELIRTLDEEGVEIKKYPASEQAYWDAKNDAGKDVAFGVYIYILKCTHGIRKGKIAIIR